jgi:hypothetical protein
MFDECQTKGAVDIRLGEMIADLKAKAEERRQNIKYPDMSWVPEKLRPAYCWVIELLPSKVERVPDGEGYPYGKPPRVFLRSRVYRIVIGTQHEDDEVFIAFYDDNMSMSYVKSFDVWTVSREDAIAALPLGTGHSDKYSGYFDSRGIHQCERLAIKYGYNFTGSSQ